MPRFHFRVVNAKHLLLFPLQYLEIDGTPTVRFIRLIVVTDLPDYLDGATEETLQVFTSMEDCQAGVNALRPNKLLYGMGTDQDRPLIVQVPTDFQMSDWDPDVVQWCRESEPFPPLPMLREGAAHIVRIPGRYLPQDPGWMRVFVKKDELVYPRHAVVNLWRAIQTHAMDASGTLLSIGGSPASGKTCAAFAFACGLVDRSVWDVVWVKYHPAALRCVKFEGAARSSCTVRTERNWPVMMAQLLPTTTPVRPTIVFFDGYITGDQSCPRAFESFMSWWRDDPTTRRLVQVHATPDHRDGYIADQSSLASCHDSECRNVAFVLPAWTLQECLLPVADDAFFAHVAHAIREDADPDPLPHDLSVAQRRQRVVRKYDICGGNVRLLFDETLSDARAIVDVACKLPIDLGFVVAVDVDHPMGKPHRHLMSRYAGIQLAKRVPPVEVLSIAKDYEIESDDRLFESWFWSSHLGYCTHPILPLRLQSRTRVGAVALLSHVAEAPTVDKRPTQDQWMRITFEDGYDGVYLDPLREFVCFVRLVHDQNQARRLDFTRCKLLLATLQNAGWWDVERVEFCYVLPQMLVANGASWRKVVGAAEVLPRITWNGREIETCTYAIGVDYAMLGPPEDPETVSSDPLLPISTHTTSNSLQSKHKE